jgi:hypothetical protein
MARRFSRLEMANKLSGGAQAGSPAKKYIDYKTGVTTVTYTRSPDSNPDGFVQKGVKSFLNPGDIFITEMSKRAFDNVEDYLAKATLNWQPVDTADIIQSNLFRAATAIIRVSSAASTVETSKITGLKYKKYTGAKSANLPFGVGSIASEPYGAVLQKIKTAVTTKSGGSGKTSVTFRPENIELYGARR